MITKKNEATPDNLPHEAWVAGETLLKNNSRIYRYDGVKTLYSKKRYTMTPGTIDGGIFVEDPGTVSQTEFAPHQVRSWSVLSLPESPPATPAADKTREANDTLLPIDTKLSFPATAYKVVGRSATVVQLLEIGGTDGAIDVDVDTVTAGLDPIRLAAEITHLKKQITSQTTENNALFHQDKRNTTTIQDLTAQLEGTQGKLQAGLEQGAKDRLAAQAARKQISDLEAAIAAKERQIEKLLAEIQQLQVVKSQQLRSSATAVREPIKLDASFDMTPADLEKRVNEGWEPLQITPNRS